MQLFKMDHLNLVLSQTHSISRKVYVEERKGQIMEGGRKAGTKGGEEREELKEAKKVVSILNRLLI